MNQLPHILSSIPKFPTEHPEAAAPFQPICSIFRRYLHQARLKFTPERAMILDAVMQTPGLFQPDDLVADLKKSDHRVSRATVYRTLTHLQDAGILKQVIFDNKQTYYELIAGRQNHDHLICVVTGKVIDISSDKLRKLRDEICREYGFDPLSHQFHIYGVSSEGGKSSGRSTNKEI